MTKIPLNIMKMIMSKLLDGDNYMYLKEEALEIIRDYYSNGKIRCEEYFLINSRKRYRIDGPAYILYYDDGNVEFEGYFINSQLHREDGPARIWYYQNGKIEHTEYWIDGYEIIYEQQINQIQEKEKELNDKPIQKNTIENTNIENTNIKISKTRKITILNEDN